MAAQDAAAAPLGMPGHVVRSAGGIKVVEAMLQLPGGRARAEAAANKQKSDRGESNNNNDLDLGGGAATPP